MSTRALVRTLAVGGAALALALIASVAIGARAVPPAEVLGALTSPDAASDAHAIVLARVPRTLVGLVVGASLGVAGCTMQGLTRNPIADPGILGVNAGAALAVVIGMSTIGIAGMTGYLGFALLGAALATLVVWGAASAAGTTPVALALTGFAVTLGLGAVTQAVLVMSSGTLDRFRFWQVGSLTGRDAADVGIALFLIVPGAVLALALARSFDALALGEDVARSLGIPVGRVQALSGIAIVLLCGGATALAGPIGFVGLMVPHAARLLSGRLDHRSLLALSALLGPVLVLAADVVGRVVLPPGEVPVGVLTALIGIPLFVVLVARGKQVAM